MGLLDMLYAVSSTLKPVSPPVGVYHGMARTEPLTIVLREKTLSISGDDFTIVDAATGEPVLKCRGAMFSLHDRKKITDAAGNLLFNVAEKSLAIGKAFVAQDKNGHDVMWVRKKRSLGSKLEATFLDAGREEVAHVSGDFWGGSANIALKDGTALAHISRHVLNASEAGADVQTYHVSIAPGVDIALVAALCILFDETENENEGAGLSRLGQNAGRVF